MSVLAISNVSVSSMYIKQLIIPDFDLGDGRWPQQWCTSHITVMVWRKWIFALGSCTGKYVYRFIS